MVKRDVFLQLCLSQVIQNETKNRRVLPLVVVSTWLLESVGSRRLPRLPDVTSFVAIARSPIPNAFSVLKKHRWEHGGAKTNWTQITLSSFPWFLCYFLKFLCWIVCGGRFCFCMIEICQTRFEHGHPLLTNPLLFFSTRRTDDTVPAVRFQLCKELHNIPISQMHTHTTSLKSINEIPKDLRICAWITRNYTCIISLSGRGEVNITSKNYWNFLNFRSYKLSFKLIWGGIDKSCL